MILFLFTTTTIFVAPSVASSVSDPISFYLLPDLPKGRYERKGHLNIGVLVETIDTEDSDPSRICSDEQFTTTFTVESTEAIAFAVDLVNSRRDILPNVTLGFVIESICYNEGVALGKSLTFLPRDGRISTSGRENSNNTHNSTCSDSCSDRAGTPLSNFSWLSHDVIGIVTTGLSHLTIPVSSLLSVGRIPMIGVTETSDELSNKLVHSYFFRIVPPDKHQVEAMLKFISVNGWSYISVLYVANDYGRNAYDAITSSVAEYGICIAVSHAVDSLTNYDLLVGELLVNSRARAVIVFTWNSLFKRILQAAVYQNATRQFIWIGSDAVAPYSGHDYLDLDNTNLDPGIGAFTFQYYTSLVPEYFKYMREQTVSNTKNPWLKKVWEAMFNCSVHEGTCRQESGTDFLQSPLYHPYGSTSVRIDAVLTLAHAADRLLKEECPHDTGEAARHCITGEKMRKYLKTTSLDGYTGRIEFDENLDMKGRYTIRQLVYEEFEYPAEVNLSLSGSGKKRVFGKEIGIYESSTKHIDIDRGSVSWSHLDVLERIIPMTRNWDSSSPSSSPPPQSSTGEVIPESVCSGPCGPGEIRIEKEVPCCWDCYRCRENERLTRGNTSCQACPAYTWPDPDSSFTACVDISPFYPSFSDPIPVLFTSLAVLALLCSFVVTAGYVIYKDKKVIKASSRELSVIQLVAIFLGYTAIIIIQTKPSVLTCAFLYFSFCMSFIMLYAPLLVKTVRIFRIFRGGVKNKRPGFISPNSQLVMAMILIAVQIILCTLTYVMYKPTAILTQHVWSENFVELSCSLTLQGLASFLGYNIVLVSLCAVFAFTVRKLPNNFNESRFISACVTTTLLIWLAFIPTYFTAGREYIRTFLASMALLLNHTVALVFLFVPKIYAARFLPPEEGEFSTTRSKAMS